jgi:hypothetical protein
MEIPHEGIGDSPRGGGDSPGRDWGFSKGVWRFSMEGLAILPGGVGIPLRYVEMLQGGVRILQGGMGILQ